jgi:hypothetical protein
MIDVHVSLDSLTTPCPAGRIDLDRATRLRVHPDAIAPGPCSEHDEPDTMSSMALPGNPSTAITRNRTTHVLAPSVGAENATVTKTNERS